MRLKRWESPRRRGRNHKGSGGSARQRQIKKQHKLWMKRLKANRDPQDPQEARSRSRFLFFDHRSFNPTVETTSVSLVSKILNLSRSETRFFRF
ncbi:hypothetical protein [Spirulina major]|uniref:hypothetical protein n=1 Tax=Spirulina major TaxID=270636 RepID=UPI0009343460